MNSANSYFDIYKNQNMIFPDSQSEEYRYSEIIKKIMTLKISSFTQKKIDLSWESDYIFCGDLGSNLKKISYKELPYIYHRYKNYFKSINLIKDDIFYYMNCEQEQMSFSFVASKGSILSDKLYINIPEGKNIQLYLYFYTEEESLSIPMIYINAEKSSSVDLIYIVDGKYNQGVVAPLFELVAEEKSHISLQNFTEGVAYHRLSFIGYSLGAESHIDLRTSFYLKEKENCDLFIRIFHESPKSTSNQIIKSVVLDQARINFNGQIYANNKAHDIYAYQMLKGIILGEDAQIMARPQLDIEYYQLACSHGISISGFDPEELFYLKSRGIKDRDIYQLLLYGFFSEPFVGISLEKYWISKISTLLGLDDI